MSGIVAIAGQADARDRVTQALRRLPHRGPDSSATWHGAAVALGHAQLASIDRSDAGRQPMTTPDGRYTIVFDGVIYNHVELRAMLDQYPFVSRTNVEVILAAWCVWGEACLDSFLGMFAFVIWDAIAQRLVAVRDRFGVKPLYVGRLPDGGIVVGSEIKALRGAGVESRPDHGAWATYLVTGALEASRTFWSGIEAIPAGSVVEWQHGRVSAIRKWYDLAARVGPDHDERPDAEVHDEYRGLLEDSVRFCSRAAVPVGINLSGGVSSSILLALAAMASGDDALTAFTYCTGDDRYDELPWVQALVDGTRHRLVACELAPAQVPDLARHIADVQDEPFGGVPTLAYANLFSRAHDEGVIALLDGHGMDEQWAGYAYYRAPELAPLVPSSTDSAVRADCLAPAILELVEPHEPAAPFRDRVRDLQFRDITMFKLPRILRFNDRASAAFSTEVRVPFLDHRLVELAIRQRDARKIGVPESKPLLRELATTLWSKHVEHAPKRQVQTAQREWLRGPLHAWADELIESAFSRRPDWFDMHRARQAWRDYAAGRGDNSFWVWQWISIGLGPA